MNEDSGEIREANKISDEERKLGKWSEPFKKGEIIEVLGIRMEIIKIKKVRGEILLRAARGK